MEDINNSVGDDESELISRVGPWLNKEEFDAVHEWLFSDRISHREKALERLIIWKLRRQALTPATIMSTIAILEVQIKDKHNTCTEHDLRAMYSNAFTKFVNYVTTLVRGRQFTSMFAAAVSLGIEPFLVDLRHLCTHGQVLPALDLSRRAADYCMDWLRQFYWDRERAVICDANVQDVRLKSSAGLEENVHRYFLLYDAVTNAILAGCKTLTDIEGSASGICDDVRFQKIEEYATEIKNNKLNYIADNVINKLAMLSNSTGRDRGNDNIYFDTLFAQKYFMQTSAKMAKSDRLNEFIGLHQNLFRLFAIAGFINTLFERFVTICEDTREKTYLREAAALWATQIADGFILFKEFKKACKEKKEQDIKFDMDIAPINTGFMPNDIKKIYKEIGLRATGSKLIFGDTVRRPWDLYFDRNYIIDRVLNVNEYTKDVIERCIMLTDPPIPAEDVERIQELIKIYNRNEKEWENGGDVIRSSDIFTVDQFMVEQNMQSSKGVNSDNIEEPIRHGVWEEAPDDINWKYIPLGAVI